MVTLLQHHHQVGSFVSRQVKDHHRMILTKSGTLRIMQRCPLTVVDSHYLIENSENAINSVKLTETKYIFPNSFKPYSLTIVTIVN